MHCDLCPRRCRIEEGHLGFCGARTRSDDRIVPVSYGRTTGLAADPIEKKPLYHFYPGSRILSLGTIGCNLACSFCQNWKTARSNDPDLLAVSATPEEIVRIARENACPSVAFTYNEPIVWTEYAVAIARECRPAGIRTVAVSNGYIAPDRCDDFFGMMDAVNIDLKSFSEDFYREHCKASLAPVLETLRFLARHRDIWLEVTTLLIPGWNDSNEELEALTEWVYDRLGPETPLHFSAFHPAYRVDSVPSTPSGTLFRAKNIAEQNGLKFVYTGNIDDPAGQATHCPQCGQEVISRNRFRVEEYHIDEESCCRYCGQTIAGRFDE